MFTNFERKAFFANYLAKKNIQLYYEYFTFQRSQRKQFNKNSICENWRNFGI